MKTSMNRRMFLRGAGGAALAIPFLPSLTTKAFAQDPELPPVGKCFFATCTAHGDIWNDNMYPTDALLTQSMPYADRDVRYGTLPSIADSNGNVSWSPVFTASAQKMTPTLAAKFNVLRGLDIPYYISHNSGGWGGHFNSNGTGAIPGVCGPGFDTPTIDQFMAYSDSFYSELDLNTKMTQRSFCFAPGLGCYPSHNYTTPSARKGQVIMQKAISENRQLHKYLFQPAVSYAGLDTTIIDHVKDRYDALKRHPRISRGDLLRLDQHIESIHVIERKIQVAAALPSPPPQPSMDSDNYLYHHSFPHDPVENALWCDLMTDVIASAFSTGVSRIATGVANVFFTSRLINDWHGSVGHSGLGSSIAQGYAIGYNQGTFEHILVGLAAKLDAIETHDGQTLLDHSLLMQASEAGQVTHHGGCVNTPIVTAGGGGGFFNTGMFVDFTNQNRVYQDLSGVLQVKPGIKLESPGLLYNQFLANILLAMGIPNEEWEHFSEFSLSEPPERTTPTKGYGYFHVDPQKAADYAMVKPLMSDPLPVITNT